MGGLKLIFFQLCQNFNHDSANSNPLFIRSGHLECLGSIYSSMYALDGESFAATANASTFGGFGALMAFFSGSILLYKNRNLQLLIVRLGMVICLFVLGALIWIIQGNGASADWGVVIPFINVVLAFMASKGIQKDEAKVRSLDRLR